MNSVHTYRTIRAIKPSLYLHRYSTVSFDTTTVADKFNLSPTVLTQALTHKSYRHGKEATNERLEYLGRRCIEFYVTDANMTKDTAELEKTLKRVFDMDYLVSKFDVLQIEDGVRCNLPSKTVSPTVKKKTLQALVGAIYHERGLYAAKEFTHKYVL